jgi:ribose transport system permease protein
VSIAGAGPSPDLAPDDTVASKWVRSLRQLASLQRRVPLLQVIALGALFLYGVETLPGLASWVSIRDILNIAALVGLASAGQTLLILMGGFDLSIAGMIVASGLVVTVLKGQHHWSFAFALLVAAVGAGVLGAAAGQICHRFRIQPLVVTLAMGTIAVGLVQTQTKGVTDGGAPQGLVTLAQPATKTFGLPIPPVVAIWLVVIVLMTLFLHRTSAGRHLLATGANLQGAENSLVPTRRFWTVTFAVSAVGAALAGVLIGGFAGTIDGNTGSPYLFESVIAVIVGGTVFGGPGDYTWTVVGALFISVLNIVLVGHGASAAAQQIIFGVVILIAVSLYSREGRIRDRV